MNNTSAPPPSSAAPTATSSRTAAQPPSRALTWDTILTRDIGPLEIAELIKQNGGLGNWTCELSVGEIMSYNYPGTSTGRLQATARTISVFTVLLVKHHTTLYQIEEEINPEHVLASIAELHQLFADIKKVKNRHYADRIPPSECTSYPNPWSKTNNKIISNERRLEHALRECLAYLELSESLYGYTVTSLDKKVVARYIRSSFQGTLHEPIYGKRLVARHAKVLAFERKPKLAALSKKLKRHKKTKTEKRIAKALRKHVKNIPVGKAVSKFDTMIKYLCKKGKSPNSLKEQKFNHFTQYLSALQHESYDELTEIYTDGAFRFSTKPRIKKFGSTKSFFGSSENYKKHLTALHNAIVKVYKLRWNNERTTMLGEFIEHLQDYRRTDKTETIIDDLQSILEDITGSPTTNRTLPEGEALLIPVRPEEERPSTASRRK